MRYINNNFNVTMTPGSSIEPTYTSSAKNTSFSQAANENSIYQGNGLICQQKMCQSIANCDNVLACANHPEYSKIQQF